MGKTVTSRFVLKGDNQLNSAFGKAKQQMAAIGKRAAIAGVAIGALFARSVIKNTIEQEQAVAQLNASLKSTGRFSTEASDALQDYAAALQQNSTFGDEAIIAMQSQLLTFKQLGGEVLPRTTQAVLDLSTKMDQGLKESAVQLGKALNDPVANLGALGRVGIQFSNDQKKLIKTLAETGRLAEAQAIILDELESEFGGAAKAARDTLGGALSVLSNNFGDLLEVTGDNSSGVTGAINDLADMLADPDVKQGFQDLATGALELLRVLVQLPATVSFLTDEFRALFGIIDDDDIVRLDQKLESLNEQLVAAKEAQGGISGFFFGDLADEEVARIENEIEAIEALLKARQDAAAFPPTMPTDDPAGRVAGTIGAGETGPTGPTEEEIKKAADARKKIVAEGVRATDTLRQSLRDLAAETGGPVVEANQRLEDALAAVQSQEDALRAVGELSLKQESALQDAREGTIIQHQREIELLKLEAEELANVATPAQQMLADLQLEIELQGLSNLERAKKIALLQAETDASTEAGQAIIESMNKIAANDDVIRAMDSFRAAGADALVAVADGSKSAKDAFGDFMNTLRERILRMLAEKLIEQLVGGFGSTGAGTGGIASFFGSLFGGGRAHGGPVSAGIPYLVGERGPELVVPRSAGSVIPNNQLARQTGSQTTNITVNLPSSRQRRTAQQIAHDVSRIQQRANSRNR